MKEAAQSLSWVTTAALGKPVNQNEEMEMMPGSPGGRAWYYNPNY